MTDGRTYWWGKDSAWWRRERIVELGEEFGADGPAVVDWLSCEAKAQNDAGRVKAGVRSAARGCFVDAVTVRHVLSAASRIGLLDDFEEADGRFTCRISGWQSDQERARGAERSRAARERKSAASDGDSPDEPDAAPSVTDRGAPSRVTLDDAESLTGQDRTGEKTPTQTRPQGAGNLPDPPVGKRKTDQARWHQSLREFAEATYGDTSPDRLRAIEQAAHYAKARTPEQVSEFLQLHWPKLKAAA